MQSPSEPAVSEFAIPAIEMSGVDFTYHFRGRTNDILRDFNLSVAPGEFVCLLGGSGSGKSTILTLAAGFITPSSGSVRTNGTPVVSPGPDRGVVFQEFMLFPWLTVRQNIMAGLSFGSIPAGEAALRVDFLLEAIGMQSFASHYPAVLSGGMQQRVALARTLATRPQILLMDEPFGALDAQTRQLMQTLLLTLWERDRQAILFVTHDIDEALYLADKIYVITGRPAGVSQVFEPGLPRPRVRDVYQEDRYIRVKRDILNLIFT
jgi:NitT/TauT family transport system ATP-binding protein